VYSNFYFLFSQRLDQWLQRVLYLEQLNVVVVVVVVVVAAGGSGNLNSQQFIWELSENMRSKWKFP
jgi:hypothetical protein